MRKPKTATILGAGPAGLAVAEAMNAYSIEVSGIWTAPTEAKSRMAEKGPLSELCKKSELHGAQFLHGPIWHSRVKHPEPVDVRYSVQGPTTYGRKVYGPEYTGWSSAGTYPNGHTMPGWDIRNVYDQLWDLWNFIMRPVFLTPQFMDDLLKDAEINNKHVFCTVPRKMLCWQPDKHAFQGQKVWAIGDNDTFQVKIPDNTILMNGLAEPRWYRQSHIFGHTTVEWPGGQAKPPVEGVVPVIKPIAHTCTCWKDRPVTFLGRYGAWQKSQLVHKVYDEARAIAYMLYLGQTPAQDAR